MPTDSEFVEKLLNATQEGRVDWLPTAIEKQFAAAFSGKWTVLVDQSRKDPDQYWLTLKDSDGQEMLTIFTADDRRISLVFEAARRQALKVDVALADVIKELDKPPKG
jgi:hypothetical protein